MPAAHRPLSIAGLVGDSIILADGRRVGRVVDVEVATGANYTITALLYGRYAWLYRLRVLQPLAHKLGIHVKPQRIPWHSVAGIEPGIVRLNRRLPGHLQRAHAF